MYLNVKIYAVKDDVMTYRDRARMAGQEWQRERPELDVEPMVLLGRLAEAAQLIQTHHGNPFMAKHGLKSGEFDVLATLRRAGKPHALTPTALYAATMLSSGGMTNRIDRLAELGLVERRAHPDDRRGTLVALTDKGLALIDGMIAAHVANRRRVADVLSATEQEALCALLAKLIMAVDPESPGYIGGVE